MFEMKLDNKNQILSNIRSIIRYTFKQIIQFHTQTTRDFKINKQMQLKQIVQLNK